MSESEARAELRRIVREAIQLHQQGQLSEAELRDIAAYALSLEITDFLNLSFAGIEQRLARLMEQSLDNIVAAPGAGSSS